MFPGMENGMMVVGSLENIWQLAFLDADTAFLVSIFLMAYFICRTL